MTGRIFRIGSRGSRLALLQAQRVQARLEQRCPGHRFGIQVISTRGDELPSTPISSLGAGAFTRAIEAALLDGRVDFAVHSLKDLPVQEAEHGDALVLAAFPEREDPRDALVSHLGYTLDQLPRGGRVATGSPRRAVQLLAMRPDLRLTELRGNIDTRLRKLREQGLDALVIAAAGLARLGLLDQVTQYFEPDQVTPAVGQGALAVQCRSADEQGRSLAAEIDSVPVRLEAVAERAVLAELGGGCRVPVGALARVAEGRLTLLAAMAGEDGTGLVRRAVEGPADEAEAIGRRMAAQLGLRTTGSGAGGARGSIG